MSIIKAETRNQETWVRTNDFALNASANVVSLNISIVPSIHLFQDEYRNISFIPELTSRLDSTVNVFIQIRLYATRTFQRICKKKRKEKKGRKTSVKGIWKIPSNFWIMKLRECGCTRTTTLYSFLRFPFFMRFMIRNF